ncbi:dihydrofolate reductase family protein [Segetibacter koreensis]|uniref:dihydrofolate reductase family protein n=1 Tax=Segetibacter koreensis TaxID=398037 RepID=UPI00035F16CE|nr:dihydrofolate reductase family protein [Segetibacter koreensis]
MATGRKVVLYIAMSLEGFIAKRNDDISFLSIVEQKGQDYGYGDFIKTIDTVILGRKTYDKVLTLGIPFPHSDKKTFVITRTAKPPSGNITFYTGNITNLVLSLKQEAGKNIFIDGGAEVVHEMMKQNLIDEFIISIIPIFLGEGIPLFKQGRPEKRLQLINSKTFEKGLVQLHYTIAEEQTTDFSD